ncbi:MAG TPA: hypothetical protein VF432_30245 [Thermoanaerobaculia bacterium]
MPSLFSAILTFSLLAASAFAAGRELAPRPLGPSPYAQQTPQVAYAGGKYLTVWLEPMEAAGWRYLGAFTDRQGNRLSPSAFVVVPNPGAGPAQLLGTGNSFALFFPVETGILMLDIDLAGHVTGTRTIEIEDFRYDPSVAWNGTHFVAIEHELDRPTSAQAVFFDRSGAIVRKVPLPCALIRHELLSVRTDVVVTSVCESGGLRADFLDSNGAITPVTLDPANTQFGVRAAAAPAANGATLIAWATSGPEQTLKTAIVSASGTVSAPKLIAQGGGPPYEPRIVVKTATGFLLPFVQHGSLSIATLDEDGAPVAVNQTPATAFGFPGTAATDGTDVLVSDIQYESQRSRGRVRTRLISANGQLGPPETISITPSRQLAPTIGAGSGSLVGVWTEQQGLTSIVRAAHLTPDAMVLSHSIIDPNATLVSRDLAWNGAAYLTVIQRNGQLRVQRLDAFGRKVGSAMLLFTSENPMARVSVVWADDHWEVAGTDGVTAFHATVAADGDVTGWEALKLEGTLPNEETRRTGVRDVAIAWDGERTVIAWIEGQYYPCSFECIQDQPAFIATIDPIAHAVSEPHRISDPYELAESLSLATNGEEIVAAMTRYDGRTLLTALDASLETVATRNVDGVADLAWDGSTFILALRERNLLTIRRLDSSLRDAARARVAGIAPADVVGSAPSVAVAIPGNAVIGIQEVDSNNGARAVAYVEQEVESLSQRRRTVRR